MKKPGLFVLMLIAVLLQVASLIISLTTFDPLFSPYAPPTGLFLLNALIISILILYTLVLCLSQIDHIPKIHYGEDVMPGTWAFYAAIVNLVIGIIFLFLVPAFDLSVIIFFILFILSGIIALCGCIYDIRYRRRRPVKKK